MKYTIEHNRLMEVMEDFFKKNFPEIELPLMKKNSSGKGNSGYGSGLDDYTWINRHYYSPNDVGLETPIFIEWDDRHLFSNEKWSVDEKLEFIYDFFGENNFEEFVKWYFGLDIAKYSNNKKTNWIFE